MSPSFFAQKPLILKTHVRCLIFTWLTLGTPPLG
jgi:hypothetical protein